MIRFHKWKKAQKEYKAPKKYQKALKSIKTQPIYDSLI